MDVLDEARDHRLAAETLLLWDGLHHSCLVLLRQICLEFRPGRVRDDIKVVIHHNVLLITDRRLECLLQAAQLHLWSHRLLVYRSTSIVLLCRDDRLISILQRGVLVHLSTVEAHGFCILSNSHSFEKIICDSEVCLSESLIIYHVRCFRFQVEYTRHFGLLVSDVFKFASRAG